MLLGEHRVSRKNAGTVFLGIFWNIQNPQQSILDFWSKWVSERVGLPSASKILSIMIIYIALMK